MLKHAVKGIDNQVLDIVERQGASTTSQTFALDFRISSSVRMSGPDGCTSLSR